MDGRRGDAEEALSVAFGPRATVEQAVGPDEGEILALLFGEAGWGWRLSVKQLIHFPILPEPPPPKEAIRMNLRYRVDLDQPERDELTAMLRSGKHPARKLKRAQILLAADAGQRDETIATTVVVGGSTVYRTKRRFVEMGLEAALSEE